MAFFSNNTDSTGGGSQNASASETIIMSCMEITGTVQGCGTLHIDGTLRGDLEVKDGIVVGKNGKVYGNITTGKLTVSGTVEGRIFCDELDVTRTGIISDDIHAVTLRSDGTINALILAEDKVHITSHGKVTTEKMQGKHITVSGEVKGNVTASELLEINKDGRVEGEMTITKIKVDEGGIMLGQMQTYQPTKAAPSDAGSQQTAEPEQTAASDIQVAQKD
jgi:cytoskeletal protein CcmA (bactofilin family)